jgi:hypothetical protein
MTPAYLINGDNVSVFTNGRQYVANRHTHPNFENIIESIKNKDWDNLPTLFDVKMAISQFTQGMVEIVDNQLYYNNALLNNVLTERILEMFRNGFDVAPMSLFLQNLMLNPSRTSVEELYLFLEATTLPITEDGHFLAYKKVRDDFRDIYTGKFDNSPGQVVREERNKVDDQRDNTCSNGLHFCSLSYLRHYGTASSNRVVIVKINPKDVVSIPSDYNNAKGRCCEYTVVGEYMNYTPEVGDAFNKPVYSYRDIVTEFTDDDYTDDEYVDDDSLSEEQVQELVDRDSEIDCLVCSLNDKIYNLEQSIEYVNDPHLAMALQSEIRDAEEELSNLEQEQEEISAKLIENDFENDL